MSKHQAKHQPGGFAETFQGIAKEGKVLVRNAKGDRSPYRSPEERNKRTIYPSAENWKGEGEDHINIDLLAQTELGKMLDFKWSNGPALNHNLFLDFPSISNFWAYISSEERPDIMRRITGPEQRLIASQLTNRKVSHLRAIIMDAAYQRIKGDSKLSKLMFENELPFDVYRVHETGVCKRPDNHEWVTKGYTEIQKAMHEGRDPNFSFLCTNPEKPPADIYESVRPKIPQHVKKREEDRKAKLEQENQKQQSQPKPPKPQKPQKSETAVAQPKPQVKQAPPKPRTEVKNFDPEKKHCLIVPVISHATDTLFVEGTEHNVEINGITIPTGAVVADVQLPLLNISHNDDLMKLGLISATDVVRAGPWSPVLFEPKSTTSNVIELTSFVVSQPEENIDPMSTEDVKIDNISVPVKIVLNLRSFSRAGDSQSVENSDDGMLTLKRDILMYRPVNQIVMLDPKKQLKIFDQLKELKGNIADPSGYKFVVLRVQYTLQLRTDFVGDEKPSINLTGQITPVGISNGTYDNETKDVRLLDEPDTANSFAIAGYTFKLLRGQLHMQAVEVASDEGEVAVDNVAAEMQAPAIEPEVASEVTTTVDISLEARPSGSETVDESLETSATEATTAVEETAVTSQLETVAE